MELICWAKSEIAVASATTTIMYLATTTPTTVTHGNWSVARLLVERGANTDKRDGDHYPPLCRIVQQSNNVAMVSVLLEHGANIEGTNLDGWTALREAIYHARYPMVAFLLDKGGKIDSRVECGWSSLSPRRGWTCLIDAAFRGDSRSVIYLLDQSADTEAADTEGWTALRAAVKGKHDRTACTLILGGANSDTTDNYGISVISKATEYRLTEFLAQCKTMEDDVEAT